MWNSADKRCEPHARDDLITSDHLRHDRTGNDDLFLVGRPSLRDPAACLPVYDGNRQVTATTTARPGRSFAFRDPVRPVTPPPLASRPRRHPRDKDRHLSNPEREANPTVCARRTDARGAFAHSAPTTDRRSDRRAGPGRQAGNGGSFVRALFFF
jgi:hypothetical protein